MLLAVAICLLLLLNMIKTNREVEALGRIEDAIKEQAVAFNDLKTTINSAEVNQILPRAIDPVIAEPSTVITFSSASPSVNRLGLPQQWQTAPDAELPDDFSPGGTLVHIRSAEPSTFTPFVSRASYANDIHQDIFEKLCWRNLEPPFEYVPGLARAWEISEDGLELTFHLFENAHFSDGKPVTSDDVIFTFDLVLNEQIDAFGRSLLADNIVKYAAIDRHTVVFHMKRPYFNALGICGNLLWILPRHIYGKFDSETYNTKIPDLCVGSGPWILESWDRGRQLVLKRNENYWGPKPAIQKQVVRIITGELAELQEFWASNADLIGPTEQQWLEYIDDPRLAELGEGISYYTPMRGYYFLGYNLRLPMLADKRVRQALTMLLDRQAMIDQLRGGLGRIVTGPFYFNSDQHDKTIEPWPYDPQRAKELLAEAGWVDTDSDGVIDRDLDGDGIREPLSLTLLASQSSLHQQYQRYIQVQFANAGIDLNIDQLEWPVFEQRLNQRDFEIIMLAWTGNPETDAYQIWHSSQTETGGSNLIGFVNEQADQLIEQARQTMDYNSRMVLWHKFHAILHEEQPYTFLFTGPRLAFANNRIKNIVRHPLRLYNSNGISLRISSIVRK